jgi:curved DNA-binding protein CbpA
MQNLYDLLGVRPDDDAETLKKAFRKAAKETHPDHHGGDPQAADRFRQISEAYEILRDADQRAAYDRLLEFERRPLNHKVKRSLFEMKRHVVYDLIAATLLAIVLAAGYQLFARIREPSGNGAASVTARESGQAAADNTVARNAAAGHDRPERVPTPQTTVAMPTAPAATSLADHDQPEMTHGEPDPNLAGQTTAVASRDSEADLPTGAGVPGKTEGEPPVPHDVPSLDSRDGNTSKPAGANTGDVKLPVIKASAHAPAAQKRHAPSRPKFEHAALENRNAPAPDNAPTPDNTAAPNNAPSRVFGVGF